MIDNSAFSFWFVIPVATLLTIFLVWQESRKPYRFRRLRIVAIILMMFGLTGVFIKPSYQTKKSSNIILLTPDYSVGKVDSLLLRHPDMMVMHMDQTVPYKNSKRIFHEELTERAHEIKVVIGQGLPRHLLDNLKKKVFYFIPAPAPEGITNLFVSENNIANRKNVIKGTYNTKHGTGWVKLNGPGGIEDSVRVKTSGENSFEFAFIPKHSGEHLYTLSIHDSSARHPEVIPIQVDQEKPLRILFLHSYPTFETQALKNFLAQKNHSMVLRYQLSKNNFRYEYVNHDQIKIDRITSTLLNNHDLIVIDGGTFSSLSAAEKTLLDQSIRSGLGLLYVTPITTKSHAAFFPFQSTSVKSDTALLKITSKSFSFPSAQLRITPNPSTIPVQKNNTGILSGYTFRGAGKIGFQLLQETYRLALAGDSISYAELWSPLLEQISRAAREPSKIRIVTAFPWHENEPIDIELISATENISLSADSLPLPLKENVSFDNIWHARTWAGTPGWHVLRTGNGTSLHYFVSKPGEWNSLSRVNQQNKNKIYARQDLDRLSEKIDSREEIPPLIFYILFLLGGGFIWLAPKL